ncbi:DUF2993 domain-containing protein [Actinoplanes sp. GCM10030250]|uniref:LmeA family phospholipid-binding protein n=1 Tax=Actinoplanes sp. GCM10030250 TaxID=3273376 RepID=UPI00361FBC7E
MAEVYETDRPRRHRGRALLVVLLVLLVLLAVGLVALDRFGASYAERVLADRVAEEVRNQKSTSGQPEVTIAGVPFLTQVLAGDYQEIHIEVPDLTTPTGTGETVAMALLDIRAKDVNAPLDTLRTGQGDVVADSVTGTGTVEFAQLTGLVGPEGAKLSEKDGKLIGSVPVKIPGQNSLELSGTAALTVDNGTVRVRFSDVTAPDLPDNPLIQNLVSSYAEQLAFDLAVPELPLNLVLQDVQVLPEGLKVTAAAQKVTLSAGGV